MMTYSNWQINSKAASETRTSSFPKTSWRHSSKAVTPHTVSVSINGQPQRLDERSRPWILMLQTADKFYTTRMIKQKKICCSCFWSPTVIFLFYWVFVFINAPATCSDPASGCQFHWQPACKKIWCLQLRVGGSCFVLACMPVYKCVYLIIFPSSFISEQNNSIEYNLL